MSLAIYTSSWLASRLRLGTLVDSSLGYNSQVWQFDDSQNWLQYGRSKVGAERGTKAIESQWRDLGSAILNGLSCFQPARRRFSFSQIVTGRWQNPNYQLKWSKCAGQYLQTGERACRFLQNPFPAVVSRESALARIYVQLLARLWPIEAERNSENRKKRSSAVVCAGASRRPRARRVLSFSMGCGMLVVG